MKRIIGIGVTALALLTLACSDSGDSVGPGGPTLSVNNVSVEEGNSLSFVVTLSQTLADDVSFNYATANGTATAGSDYTAVSGSDTIQAGTTSAIIVVATSDDSNVEATETFAFTISGATNATIAVASATGTITDNEAAAVSFANDVRPILTSRCAVSGCHGTGSVNGGMTMGTASYSAITTASGDHGAIVVVGNSAASPLYTKTTSSPPFGARMPFGQTALSSADQLKIRDWIDEGAKDN